VEPLSALTESLCRADDEALDSADERAERMTSAAWEKVWTRTAT
jgi:hypothetical protein